LKRVLKAAAFAAAFAFVSYAQAEEWPNRPIEVSVFSSAGGTTDFVNRLVASVMEKTIGTNVSVVNRTGGGGAVAMNYVWQQPHNGNYWLGASEAMQSVAVMGFTPLTTKDWHWYVVAGAPGSIAVPANSPYQTIDDLVAVAKARPGAINVSHSSIGSVWHLKSLALMGAADIKLNSVPYEGSNPAMVAALSGEVQAVIAGVSEEAEYIRGGQMRSLGVVEMESFTSPEGTVFPAIGEKFPKLADIPASQWVGFALPKDTPADIVAKVDEAFDKVMADDGLKKTLSDRWLAQFALRGEKANEYLNTMESGVGWKLQELGIAKVSPEELGIPKP